MRTDAKITTARRLRKSLTKPEVWLWVRIRERTADGIHFRRQHAIGPYVLDFYCVKAKLCVEVDGVHHTQDEQMVRDGRRDQWLAEQGILTYRIVARDLLANPDEIAQGVIELAISRVETL